MEFLMVSYLASYSSSLSFVFVSLVAVAAVMLVIAFGFAYLCFFIFSVLFIGISFKNEGKETQG
jgi:hypothetical protein